MNQLLIQENSKMNEIIIRPDAKRKINLGDLAKNVSSYRVTKDEDGKLTLIPYAEIPFSEKWIFEDKDALETVKLHLKQKIAA
jgi:hypothetical protein